MVEPTREEMEKQMRKEMESERRKQMEMQMRRGTIDKDAHIDGRLYPLEGMGSTTQGIGSEVGSDSDGYSDVITGSAKCEPGTEWRVQLRRRDCVRICKCGEFGAAKCRESCRKSPEADAERRPPREEEVEEQEEEGEEVEVMRSRLERSKEGHKKCRPHSEWMEKCNRCRCTAAGKRVCTEMSCGGGGGGRNGGGS